MTEYDFSEEGYQKYLRTQARVSNWVHHQAGCAPEYRNPFTYAPTSNSELDEREREYSGRLPRDRTRSGGTIERSPSLSRTHAQPSRSYTQAISRPPRPRSPPQHEVRHTRSRSQPRGVEPIPYQHRLQYVPPHYLYQPSPPPQPPYYGSRHRSPPPPVTIAPPHFAPAPGPGQNVTYKYYDSSREVILPPMQQGERYMIIPPNGRQIIVQRGGSNSSSRTSPSSAGQTKGPLLKRLIRSLTPTIERSEGRNGTHRRSNSTRLTRG